MQPVRLQRHALLQRLHHQRQCLAPNTCAANSCGLKDNGAVVLGGRRVQAATSARRASAAIRPATARASRASPAMLGVCSNVATGSQRSGRHCARSQDPSTCGTNGKCEAGACQRWRSGTPCLRRDLPGDDQPVHAAVDLQRRRHLRHARSDALLPVSLRRERLQAVVHGGRRLPVAGGLRGRVLRPQAERAPSASTRTSASRGSASRASAARPRAPASASRARCTASRGTCSNIAKGDVDVMSRCADQGRRSCGTDGCLRRQGRLPRSTTRARRARRRRARRASRRRSAAAPATASASASRRPSIACAPYVCNGATACLAACTGDADCLPPNICDPQTNRCGNKKRLGQPCAATSQCLTGQLLRRRRLLQQPARARCARRATSARARATAPTSRSAAADTMNRCAANPPCGNTGSCNGAGGCQLAATTVSCGTASCTGSTYTPTSRTATGRAAARRRRPPAARLTCAAATTCRTTCSMDSHCLAPYTCQGAAPNRSCALKPNGTACTAGSQCISGNCVNGVCCGSAAAAPARPATAPRRGPARRSAAGTRRARRPVRRGPALRQHRHLQRRQRLPARTASTSLRPGRRRAPARPTSRRRSARAAAPAPRRPTVSCGNYICSGDDACRTNCTADTHCSSTSLYCTGNTTTPGSCVAKKANGAACTAAHECASGNCVERRLLHDLELRRRASPATSTAPGTCRRGVANDRADPASCAAARPAATPACATAPAACQQGFDQHRLRPGGRRAPGRPTSRRRRARGPARATSSRPRAAAITSAAGRRA